MLTSGTYHTNRPQTVHFGQGALERLPSLVEDLEMDSVLVVSSPSMERNGVLTRVLDVLGEGRVAGVFTGSKEHTPIATLEETFELASAGRVTGVVSVGGGSSLDTAKGTVLALLAGGPDIGDYVGSIASVLSLGGTLQQLRDKPPVRLVAVPTTLSASEGTRQAGITGRDGVKEQYYHPDIEARGVILDPALTLATPERLWLSTGIKALDHSVEVAYSRRSNPYAQSLALGSIRLLSAHLPLSHADPEDLDSRAVLQLAAWQVLHGAVTTLANVGLNHAIVHRLGGWCGIPHGVATGITLPAVMELNRPAALQELAAIASAGFGVQAGSVEAAAAAAVEQVGALIEGLGLPRHLSEFVPDRATLAEMAPTVLTDTAMGGNPRQDVTVQEVLDLLHRCW